MMDENNHSNFQPLSDDELSAAAAGTFISEDIFPSVGEVKHIYGIGDVVKVQCFGHGTVRCRITALGSDYNVTTDAKGNAVKEYVDTYFCQKLDNALFFLNGWKDRDQIVSRA